jgi:uncharacterized RDD family membrane protein YckC
MSPPVKSALLSLDLPEHGRVDLPLAGIGGRTAAALFDALLMLFAGGFVALFSLTAVAITALDEALATGVLILMLGLLPLFGPLLFEATWRGQTPGKRFFALRVISIDGTPATAGQILLRNILRLVDFLPAGYFIGVVSMFLTGHGQRLGDLVAGTVVIREDPRGLVEAGALEERTDVPRQLTGVPETVVRAARLLAAPDRDVDGPARFARQAQLVALVRQHRPDLHDLPDAAIWDSLTQPGSIP